MSVGTERWRGGYISRSTNDNPRAYRRAIENRGSAVTAPERETAGTVRSAHVAHFLPPDWARIARIAAPALERVPRDLGAPGLLVVVPDSGATVALARALAALPVAEGHRIVAVTSAPRGKRLLAGAPATVVVGAPSALAPLLAASALKLGQVGTLLLACADDLDADDPELGALITEVPKTAARLLTALEPTAAVEQLLERHLHRARRVIDEAAPASEATPPALRYLAVTGSPVEALPSLLDETDAPTTTIVAADPAQIAAARSLLSALGYEEGPLARFSDGAVEANTTLVVFLGVPSSAQWARAIAATPAQLVAIVTPRDRATLMHLAKPAPVRPFVMRATLAQARAAEARARAELRDVLAEGIPSREILSLEPMLVEHDGLEVAAAALRLLDRTRSAQAALVRETERRMRAELAAAAPAASSAPPRSRDDRPRGDRPPRPFSPKGDRPRGPRRDDDRPRSGPRRDDDRPRGPRGPR